MGVFEILLIFFFIVLPIIEQVMKRRRGQGEPPSPPDDMEADVGWSEGPEESRPAADMLPDDLWEAMTGERRPGRGPGPDEGEERGWSSAPGGASTSGPARRAEPEPDLEPVSEEWRSEPWVVDDEVEVRRGESLEYEGPEAYSLEEPAPEPIERRVPSAEARHRAFHELIDRPKRKRKRRLSPLMRSLRSPDGLRQAVLLKEILGPPKGLE